jgi:hypothetical protein
MAQGSQAGSRLTDPQGDAVLTGLPVGAYSLHVIKSNFQTVSDAHYLSGTQERIVTLQPGASTPPAGVNCQGGGAVTTLPPITITSFEVEGLPADFKVTSPPVTHLRLRATFNRRPAFYRIVEDSGYAYTTPLQNLRTRPWEPLPPSAPVAPFIYLKPLDLARPYGTRTVHFQVSTGPVASEDAASQIKSVSVILTPGQFRTSVLTGAALQGFLDRAQQEGYGPVRPKGVGTNPSLRYCPGGRLAGLINAQTYSLIVDTPSLHCNSNLDCAGNRPCVAGVCSVRRNFYFPSVGWITADVQMTPVDSQLGVVWPSLIEKESYSAFAGPPLMPFWKITDLGFNTVVIPASGGWTIAVGGYNMVNTPGQPPIQDPERIIRVERTTRFDYAMKPVCIVGTELPSTLLPGFRSVTVVGPDGRDPREAFPPRGPTAGGPLELRPGIPPGIGPIRP